MFSLPENSHLRCSSTPSVCFLSLLDQCVSLVPSVWKHESSCSTSTPADIHTASVVAQPGEKINPETSSPQRAKVKYVEESASITFLCSFIPVFLSVSHLFVNRTWFQSICAELHVTHRLVAAGFRKPDSVLVRKTFLVLTWN